MELGTGLTVAAGAVTLLCVAFGGVPGRQLNRAGIALVGAALTVVVSGAGPLEVLSAVDLGVMGLLLGLMLVNAALVDAGFFISLLRRVKGARLGPRSLLLAVVVFGGAASALFLNDTVVLLLTPFLVGLTRSLGLRPLPYLLALALAANAGSVATITGNPQNVLVAVASGIGYVEFAAALGPVALMALAVVVIVISAVHGKRLRTGLQPAVIASGAGRSQGFSEDGGTVAPRGEPRRLLAIVAVLLAMLIGFLVGVDVTLAALVAGGIALVLSGRRAVAVVRGVDFELLALFIGLFVTVDTLNATGVVAELLAPAMADFYSAVGAGELAWYPAPPHLAQLGAVTVAMSTLLSNVPAVLLLLPWLDTLVLSEAATTVTALTVAMASTLAGNLTLLSSVANLIVVESARRHGVEVGFWQYLLVGLPTTVITLVCGWLWLAYAIA